MQRAYADTRPGRNNSFLFSIFRFTLPPAPNKTHSSRRSRLDYKVTPFLGSIFFFFSFHLLFSNGDSYFVALASCIEKKKNKNCHKGEIALSIDSRVKILTFFDSSVVIPKQDCVIKMKDKRNSGIKKK